MRNRPNYVIVTPARDEEAHIQQTIDSVVQQTARPTEWVIVDDGSKDGTGGIIDACSREHAWIQAVHLDDRGERFPGAGVMTTFFRGVEHVGVSEWDYLVKLDGDLAFGADYFASCLERFEAEPRLGIGGGRILSQVDGTLIDDDSGAPRFHVRGATKIYRRRCWDDIGGPQMVTGWDTLDEIKANMLGWATRTFPNITLRQLRSTGAVQGVWRNAVKNGHGSYVAGYHPLFMLCKCIKRMCPPAAHPVESAGLAWGFMGDYWRRATRAPDAALLNYLRDQQLRKLLFRETIWK